MIKHILHKIFSVNLAILVLLSTVSFTVEKHFCGDRLVDVAVFSDVERCGGMEASNSETTSVTKKSCCKDTLDVIEGQELNNIKVSNDWDFDKQQLFVATYLYSYANLFEGLPEQIIPFKDYSPPNLIYDIHVLDEVYLI